MKNKSAKNLWLIGAGGQAKVVVAACQNAKIKIDGLFDNNKDLWNTLLLKTKILPPPEPEWWKEHWCFLALGNNQARKKLSEIICPQGWETVIHPTATIHSSAVIGEGTYIGAHAIIQPDAVIGKHVIINTGAIIEHDSTIESFCHIAPRTVLAGGVRVGEGALVGVGSSVIPGILIDSWTIIGAGSAVVKNIPSRKVAAGVPCRVISSGVTSENDKF